MTNSTQDLTTYELCFAPRDADMLVYRSIPAGICSPFSESVPCKTREDAEGIAFNMGYLISGEWAAHANYDSADLVRMS